MQRTLKQLADWLGVEFSGDPGLVLTGVGTLESADEHTLSFLANPKYKDQLSTTRAGAVVLSPDTATQHPCLRSKNPYADFTKVVTLFAPPVPLPPAGVHPLAVVHPDAQLGDQVAVGPFCVIGAGARLGDRTVLVAQVFGGEQAEIGDDQGRDESVVADVRRMEGVEAMHAAKKHFPAGAA
ncbi:MAG: hypothetical protein HGA76_09350, partial [Candidatus Firestonebacteria bacterium]|nr:hypothetical protein [Candidatus Firestonebacteria bacterium]